MSRYGDSPLWTKERVEFVIQRWNAGDSASVIARKLNCGFTKNSIIGKVYRLRLKHRGSATFTASANRQHQNEIHDKSLSWLTPAREARLRELHTSPLSMVSIAVLMGSNYRTILKYCKRLGLERPHKGRFRNSYDEKPSGVVKPPVPPKPVDPAPDGRPVALMDRRPDQCGWILGNTSGPATLMCGAPKGEGPYCAYHDHAAHWHGTSTSVYLPGLGRVKLEAAA